MQSPQAAAATSALKSGPAYLHMRQHGSHILVVLVVLQGRFTHVWQRPSNTAAKLVIETRDTFPVSVETLLFRLYAPTFSAVDVGRTGFSAAGGLADSGTWCCKFEVEKMLRSRGVTS